MRIRKAAAVMIAVLLATVGASVAPAATAKSYKNCTALNKDYPHGVGRRGAKDKTSGKRVRNFKVSTRLYQRYDGKPRAERDLDRDNDGIACEKR